MHVVLFKKQFRMELFYVFYYVSAWTSWCSGLDATEWGGNHKAAGGQLDCEDEEQEEEKGKLHAGESFCSLLDYCSLLIAGFGKGCSSNTAVV